MVNRITGLKWMSVPAISAWLLLGSLLFSPCAAEDIYGGSSSKSFSKSIKDGFNKMGETFSSKPKPEALPETDATSLSSDAKPGVDTFLSLAKCHEEANKPDEAEAVYKKALQASPNHKAAMLSYAHFLENQGRFDEALANYQLAIKAHPKDASPYNNLGLCYARMKKIKEATAALNRAVQLDPQSVLYRNNIAAVLVETNRLPDAFEHLRSVHGDAKAYYNLGYLLSKKGDMAAAEHHFRQALSIDPTMQPAARWLAYLQRKPGTMPANRNARGVPPAAGGYTVQPVEQVATRILPPPAQHVGPSLGQPPAQPLAPTTAPQANPFCPPQGQTAPDSIRNQDLPPYPDSFVPKRLPPVTVRQPVGPAMPGNIAETSETAPAAPLPPGMTVP